MTAVPATLIYYVGSDNEWQWRMLDGDGEVIADSALPIDPTTRPRDAFYLPVATPTFAAVLAAGNTADGATIEGGDGANGGAVLGLGTGDLESGGGGPAILFAGAGLSAGKYGSSAAIVGGTAVDGGAPAFIDAYGASNDGAGTNGKIDIRTDGTLGGSGEVLTSDGTYATWQGVPSAAGVPSGAPTAMPFAYDTTAVTGGFYFWDGAAWVKVATIL